MKKPLVITAEAKNNKAVIRIDGYISNWNNHAAGFKSKLDQLVADGITEAEIYINSEGGSCFQANEIANELGRFTGTKTARLGALCASAATYIACKCDYVIAARNVSYMIHKPMAGADGNEDDLESVLKALRNIQAEYQKTYSEKTKMKAETIAEMWKKDYWMNASEAKTLGFINEVEGEESDITPEDIASLQACGYKTLPTIEATVKPTPENHNPENNIMKDKLITVLALAATLSDAQIIAHIEGLKAKAAKTDELERKIAEIEATAKATEIKAVLDTAENNKQILPSQRAYFEKQLKADFSETKSFIEALPKAVKLSEHAGTGQSNGGEDRSKWTYSDYQEKDPAALAKMADEDEEKFNKLAEAHYGKSFKG